MSENILEIRGLSKAFGPTKANCGIDLTLRRGEIHGLIGENGSGKSTLISQIAGVYAQDEGTMLINGKDYAPRNPLEANAAGVSMVMQELGVVGTLPAVVNVYLGRTKNFSERGFINRRKMKAAAEAVFEKWGLPPMDVTAPTEGMLIEQRKIIELARALSNDPDIILLDEITQSLSHDNREMLYGLLKRLKELGKSVIVITHDVEELIAITDTITVLRDGEAVGDVVSADTTPDEIKSMMVGREIHGEYYRSDSEPDYRPEAVLSVKNLTVAGEIEDLSFDVHAGEILAFCGLSDSGIHEVGKALYKLSKRASGSVKIGGEEIKNPTWALKNNIAYVPKDRDNEAMMIHASILNNMVLPSLDDLQGAFGYLPPRRLKALAKRMIEQLSVKTDSSARIVDSLSGGNKQKVNLGRWLAKNPKLLILDSPTRGVDVGVKAYIYSLMRQAKAEGAATVLISDELTEALGMADRLVVMKDGKIVRVLNRGKDFTEQAVIEVMV